MATPLTIQRVLQQPASRTNQHRILNQFLGKSTPVPTFDQALDWSKRAFITLRYAYRRSTLKDQEGWSAQEIWNGTRQLIVELHPDWPR
jgi:hypothetical protein